jgi:tetratricopeptide (TPR) repeat protein
MRLGTTCILACVAIGAVVSGERRACAETPDILTSEQRTAAAREHFDRGNSYFESGQYDQAIKEFEQSYQIKAVPLLLFDIGNVARVSGKNEMAIDYFRRYLRAAPPGTKERIEARRFVAEMTRPGYKAPARAVPAPAETPPAAPAATPVPAAAVAASPTSAPAADKQPLYRKWWLWTAVGGAVVAVGLGVGLGVGLSQGYSYPRVPGSVGTVRF